MLYEFCALLIRISFWRSNPYFGLHKLQTKLVPFPDCLIAMLDEVVLPNAKRDDSLLFREKLQTDKKLQDALASVDGKLKKWWEATTQSTFLREGERKILFQQWQDLMKNRDEPGMNLVGQWQVHQESEITGDERCRNIFRCSLSLPQCKMAFMNSQSLDQLSAGAATENDAMTTLDFDEFKECIARVAIEKYKSVKAMSEADAIKGFMRNLLREANEEEVMVQATVIRADRYDWRRSSKPLEGESLSDFKKWLAIWQRIEIMDMYYFPLWEKGVHDCLQKHQKELMECFLGYTRSISEDSAEDALEMSMGEFHDFVVDCRLETKAVTFDVMTNMFVKANATNTAQVYQQRMDEKRNAEGKEHESKIGEKGGAKKAKKVAGKNDGTEAKMDQELVYYEFLNMLVRISFQRANPTFGNFGSKAEIVHLPGCLEKMIVEEIFPRSRRDIAHQFRETVWSEMAVQSVIEEYRERMHGWYKSVTANDADANVITDKLTFEDWLRVCKDGDSNNANKPSGAVERNALVGVWRCHRESEVNGDPRTKSRGTNYEWSLSVPQIKAAFMDSQQRDQMGAAQASATDDMAVLDFDEFLECVARCGVDKYKAVKEMTPADAIKGLMQNMLGEAEEEEVVVNATYIRAPRWDHVNGCRMATEIISDGEGGTMMFEDVEPARPLSTDAPGDFEKWLDCWTRIEIMDMHLFPLWEKDVHDILQPLFKELQLIFLAYTRSISETNAEDAKEMDMGEFHDFVVDVGLETKTYTFDVMSTQFVKANVDNVAQVQQQKMQGRKNASSKDDLEEQKAAEKAKPKKIAGDNKGGETKKDAELVLYEFISMLVRISFWRCNPTFGNFGDKSELIPVAAALQKVLNEVILPNAKRETSGAFREKQMQDAELLAVVNTEYKEALEKWYNMVTSDDSKANVITDKLTFEDWLRVLNQQDLVGVWEVEQMSEITGDASAKANIKCRLSIPTCKAAFFDSQKVTEMGVGQSTATDATNVVDYEEFVEMIARVGCAKYSAVKVMSDAKKVRAMIQNMTGERDELTVLREDTYIRAERYDFKNESKPLAGMAPELHAAFLADFERINLQGVYGFPTWEQSIHDLLLLHYAELKSIFGAYCKTLGVTDETAMMMDMEEFRDFVLDVKLETHGKTKDTSYTFEQMGAAFAKANESGKGMAGPPADAELQFYEFLGVLVRTCFCTMNPSFGEMLAGDGSTHDTWPTDGALKKCLEERILPNAQREVAPTVFRTEVMSKPEVQAIVSEYRERLQGWFNKIPFDTSVAEAKLGIVQWEALLKQLNVVGTFTCEQGSDVVGDANAGTIHTIRLSVPQAKAAFANAQNEASAGGGVDAITCDFDEMLECDRALRRRQVPQREADLQGGGGARHDAEHPRRV